MMMNTQDPSLVTCEEYAMFIFFSEDKMDFTCQKCKLIGLLE